MSRPVTVMALAFVAGMAFLFARFGFWQLDRLAQRRQFNALVTSRTDSAAVAIASLPADTSLLRFRRVRVEGTYDFDNEVVLVGRSRNGSPGVQIVTPLRVPGRDTAVLVNRGWVYSPDATEVDLSRWREPEDATVEGFVDLIPLRPGEATARAETRAFRWLDPTKLDGLFPYPVHPLVVVALGDTVRPPPYPARLEVPPLSEGSHLSYAIQWFAFAAIALGGGVLLARRERRRDGGGMPG